MRLADFYTAWADVSWSFYLYIFLVIMHKQNARLGNIIVKNTNEQKKRMLSQYLLSWREGREAV